ncbi:MAG TPA: GNAT family N-acetyltransferase [Phenylobacterium sp.]|jgi:N-acetylglutamate synthase-like GNAT family acetyltransferase
MPGQVQILERDDLDTAFLEDRLYEFNVEATGYRDGQDFGLVIEEAGEVAAAAAGYTWGGICELKQLWVRADQRGRGRGSVLLEGVVELARDRGCRLMFLATHSFQAPDFYARHGFEIVATVPDKPLGHSEHIMRRTLGDKP